MNLGREGKLDGASKHSTSTTVLVLVTYSQMHTSIAHTSNKYIELSSVYQSGQTNYKARLETNQHT